MTTRVHRLRGSDWLKNVLLLLFTAGGLVFTLGLLLQPDIRGYGHVLAEGISVQTSQGVVVVSHSKWVMLSITEKMIIGGIVSAGVGLTVAAILHVFRLSEMAGAPASIWRISAVCGVGWALAGAGLFVRLILGMAGFSF